MLSNLLVLLILFRPGHTGQTSKSDTCEYDLDLTRNTIKISCEGTPSVVNIYAEKAVVQEGDQPPGSSNFDVQHHVMEELRHRPGRVYGRNKTEDKLSRAAESSTVHSKPGSSSRDHRPLPTVHWDRKTIKTDNLWDVMMNTSKKLEIAKRSFAVFAESLKNISGELSQGDNLLKQDMDNLKKTSNSATDLKLAIVSAITSQYNYMRSALALRNYELETLVTSLLLLVDATSDGLSSALKVHNSSLQQISDLSTTLTAVRKQLVTELKKRQNKKKSTDQKKGRQAKIKAECPKTISAIGTGSHWLWNSTTGVYMVESVNPSEYRPAYIMSGSGPSDVLMEFDLREDVNYGIVSRYFSLPFMCIGTGHAVYRRHFYCHKMGTNQIVKYHLKRMDIIAELSLPGATYGNVFPYTSGENSDIDLAVDEYGLWAIYATESSAGKIVISKIDHKNMEIETTWVTSYPKTHVGNAFMLCGTLFATNSHRDTPTFIKYTFNTDKKAEKILDRGELTFPNFAPLGPVMYGEQGRWNKSANSVTLTYDFRTSELHSWSNGRIERFPIYFLEE